MHLKNIFVVFGLLILTACHSTQLRQVFKLPESTTVASAGFKHVLVSKSGAAPRLHVYIEGDGIPFESRFVIAKDPSPSNPLMLQLMELDKTQSLYLGRPCYFTRSHPDMSDPKCNTTLWTRGRYSGEVVESMVMALRTHLESHPAQGITLMGHSGGGTLAMLMAARMPEVDQVVTIAGNLDTEAWAKLHHYTPLKDSLNPADLKVNQLPRLQLHAAGDKDDNIPPALGQAVLTRMGLQMMIIRNADHNCCWAAHWATLLRQIDQQIAQ